MLVLKIEEKELWDENTQQFVKTRPYTLHLEHSLISLSRWESKYEKPFLTKDQKSNEELLDYIRFMTIDQNVPEDVYKYMSNSEMAKIKEYMESKQTATWFREDDNKKNKRNTEIITSEVIYYWMTELRIPPEYQKWHLNRLLTLVRVINEKHEEQYGDKKKMSTRDIMARNKALNAQRRARLHSKG